MNEYRIVFKCANGFEGEETVMAANRMMAFEVFADLGIEDVVEADCFRVLDNGGGKLNEAIFLFEEMVDSLDEMLDELDD